MTPDALRALALLSEVHLSPRAAFAALPEEIGPGDRGWVREVAALVALGCAPADACRAVLGPESEELAGILSRAESLGVGVADPLRSLARRLEESASHERSAVVAAAGAKVSGTIVATVPLGFLLWSVATSRLRPVSVVLTILGGALIGIGIWWIVRMMPKPRPSVLPALARSLAAAVASGLHPEAAIGLLASEAAYGSVLEPVRAAIADGGLWVDALADRDGSELGSLGRVCLVSRKHGRPLGPALIALAERWEERRASEQERDLRRAPVRMVLPLCLSILPGGLLLAVGSIAS